MFIDKALRKHRCAYCRRTILKNMSRFTYIEYRYGGYKNYKHLCLDCGIHYIKEKIRASFQEYLIQLGDLLFQIAIIKESEKYKELFKESEKIRVLEEIINENS